MRDRSPHRSSHNKLQRYKSLQKDKRNTIYKYQTKLITFSRMRRCKINKQIFTCYVKNK